ncbi:MAG TPA: DUF58 domain-containing protein [Phycisphaerae bacterium]|nr:DUF58 domain-containing protein [Phycisphaerae bacterium]HOJ73361.1 DUF58 domain-containing protein [Phycisphaerae bacterium]HOM50969.1 DUF58 domain-containing protein [Phycisphaerae bacterium]HON68693.1 DUF58 domain-containing protein [Phycisphaerae bacterium]HOQ87763.1 DUF58 domain-containing protein [Phycisphaerae bacterium]
MIPAELLKKIRRIEIRTSHIVNDVMSGQYHSAFKGRGMEFEEVREYRVGDDVRAIDWNVSARYGRPFVKVFREERELTVMLMVDMSASHSFGTRDQLKRELVAEVCATLAFSAIRNNDKVGLICFTDRIEKVVPARKGPQHVLRVIRELLYHQPVGRGTDLAVPLEHLNTAIKRKSVVFLASDFQGGAYEQPMRVARRRHDLIPIVVEDIRERELPDVGLVELKDNETGRMVLVDTSSRRVRERYRAQAQQAAETRDRLFRRMDVEAIYTRTGESFIEPLTRFFRAREARR